MSTFPFDYSSFLYIALQQYNVLLLVQVEQNQDTLRQTGEWMLLSVMVTQKQK